MLNQLYFHTSLTDDLKDIFKYPLEKQRLLYYSNYDGKPIRFVELSLAKSDEKIYFSDTEKKIMFNTKSGFFVKISRKKGFTYDSITKKLKIWYGDSINQFSHHFTNIFNGLNIDWVENKYHFLIKKGSLEKILNGKITNPIDLIKYYVKYSLKIYDKMFSYKSYYNMIKLKHDLGSKFYYSWESINIGYIVAKNKNHYSDFILNLMNNKKNNTRYDNYQKYQDIIKQALILNESINFNWSDKRIDEVHTNWSMRIMDLKSNNIDKTPIYDIKDSISYIPFNGKLLDTEHDVYLEGSKQKHCIYSNYWSSIKRGEYFCVSIKQPESITIGIRKKILSNVGSILLNSDRKDQFVVDQIYGYRNKNIDAEIKNAIVNWLEIEETQNLFNKLTINKPIDDVNKTVDFVEADLIENEFFF